MNHGIIRTIILLFITLYCIAVCSNVQAAGGVETAGNVLLVALPAAAAGLTFGFRDGEGALEIGRSAALTISVTYGLKFSVDAKRPNGGDQSFPSAHASISFASAEFVRKRYGWEYGIPAYVAATFVAYSRVESDQHYSRDVIAGAAIGIGSSYLFTQPYKGWHVQPDVGAEHYGIRVTRNW